MLLDEQGRKGIGSSDAKCKNLPVRHNLVSTPHIGLEDSLGIQATHPMAKTNQKSLVSK